MARSFETFDRIHVDTVEIDLWIDVKNVATVVTNVPVPRSVIVELSRVHLLSKFFHVH